MACSRRFAGSAIIGTDFYVVGGCRDDYEQIGDMYRLSLGCLEDRQMEGWKWEVVFKDEELLRRWGHSVVAKDEKLYIFGGRINSTTDNSDLIEFNPKTLNLTHLTTIQNIP